MIEKIWLTVHDGAAYAAVISLDTIYWQSTTPYDVPPDNSGIDGLLKRIWIRDGYRSASSAGGVLFPPVG